MSFYIMIFMIYGFLGWCVEVVYVGIGTGRFYNRGFLNMPLLPIYAIGALLINIFTTNLIPHPILLYIVGVIVTTALEYVTSYLMEELFHTRWWDYSSYKFNINGRVCLKNSLLFGILCLFVMYGINPLVINFINLIQPTSQDIIVDIFIVAFIFDLAYTLRKLDIMPIRDVRILNGKINAYREGRLKTIEELSEELQDHTFGDGYLASEIHKYTKAKHQQKPILIKLISLVLSILIIGLIVKHVQLFLILCLVSFIIFYIIYHQIKYYSANNK